ncbi:carboxylesterase family protein [uncultured Mitsuokella sp.]|uniref:carboxylesterase family protein n=1 Tax=uncultured Mitsuokella sp. TaxID=453120 RepID=UPI0025DF7275|nr:carboxylesterase family protein [uncultured Mitsuokella sp.]
MEKPRASKWCSGLFVFSCLIYIDTIIRLPMKHLSENKVSQHGAPVYAYMFTWDAPVMGGVFLSYHTAEIPFVLHHIEAGANHIGSGKEAKRLETEMSQAWIPFARTGQPSAKGLPSAAFSFAGKVRCGNSYL